MAIMLANVGHCQAIRTVQVLGFLHMRERTNWQPRKGAGMICVFADTKKK